MSIYDWLKVFRWKNLLMILFMLLLFRFTIVIPYAKTNLVLSDLNFYFFLVVILLVSAAGYLINDLKDIGIDAINNPSRVLVDKDYTVIKKAHIVYYLLNLLAFFIAVFVCNSLNKWNILSIVLSAILFLWLYAIRLKKVLLVSNLVIALLSAMCIISIAIFETDVLVVLSAYVLAGFAFLTTLLREYIKDVEDIEGDRRYGVISLPIAIGINRSKYFGYGVLTCILISLSFICKILLEKQLMGATVFVILLLIIPYFLMMYLLMKAKQKEDFKHLSRFNKLLMLVGISSLLLTYF